MSGTVVWVEVGDSLICKQRLLDLSRPLQFCGLGQQLVTFVFCASQIV